jgi:transcriptional regulator with XRE-family HTH domain
LSDSDNEPYPNEPYPKSLGQRLRAIRVQQGLSLHGVELKSGGRWKGVVIGSYERGSRAVTVQRLAELAEFYGVPVAELLPDTPGTSPSIEAAPRLILDLERLQELPAADAAPLARYTATLQSQRGDYNGRVMSIRTDDLRSLAIIYDDTPTRLAERLVSWGVLNTESRRHAAPKTLADLDITM